MAKLASGLIVLVGVVNLLPVSGVVSADRLQALYGVAFEDANVVILMRHRAVLFGIVGGLLVACAFRPSLRPVGLSAGLVSMLSFALIAQLVGGHNDALGRVAVADLVGSVALLGALVLGRFADKRESAI